MTTYFPFTPNPLRAFQFQPTFDGQPYSATIVWGLFGQRWFLNLATLDGTAVVYLPVVTSPPANPIQSITWSNGRVQIVTVEPHGYLLETTINGIVYGCVPTGYNGNFQMFVIDQMTLQYPLVQNPGVATTLGTADWIVNMVAGYFQTSTLAFRNNQFEVNP